MKTTFALIMALAATLAVAAPQNRGNDGRGPPPRGPPPRNDGPNRGNNGNNEVRDLLDLWQDKDFLGLKFTGRGEYGRCQNLPADKENRVSSAKARRGHRCTLYDQRNCRGDGFSFVDANRFPKSFNDKASSYKCDRN